MKNIFVILAVLGLGMSIISPVLTFLDVFTVALNKTLLFFGMLLWFIGAIPWLGREKLEVIDTQVEI